MVLESLITPETAEKKPWEMFFLGFIYSSVAVFLSLQIFESMAGLIAVFLTVLALVPLMYSTIKYEEKKDLIFDTELRLLEEHSKALGFFIFLFLGIVLSFTVWYVFLPADVVHNLFSVQIDTINNINSAVSGATISHYKILTKIFFNNLKVLTFCMLFAFFYGAGAIFILTWNASVISVATGNIIKSKVSDLASSFGLYKIGAYFHAFSIGLLRYMIHGLPEIIAYFIAGLAAGIISIAVIRHDFRSKNFERIVLDSSDLVLISLVLLFIAALLEVYVTPLFF